MTKTKFIQSLGFICQNIVWSWSYVDHSNKRILFGIWSDLKMPGGEHLILSDKWIENSYGVKNLGYSQAIEHLKLVLFSNYELYTFEQTPINPKDEVRKTKEFSERIYKKHLVRRGDGFYSIGTGTSFESYVDVMK
ncbi:hypothetical protein [Enterobacter kobei]